MAASIPWHPLICDDSAEDATPRPADITSPRGTASPRGSSPRGEKRKKHPCLQLKSSQLTSTWTQLESLTWMTFCHTIDNIGSGGSIFEYFSSFLVHSGNFCMHSASVIHCPESYPKNYQNIQTEILMLGLPGHAPCRQLSTTREGSFCSGVAAWDQSPPGGRMMWHVLRHDETVKINQRKGIWNMEFRWN